MSYPGVPPELAYALRVNIDNLRPWEYEAMEADVYDLIDECRYLWRSEREKWRRHINRTEPDQQHGT